MWLSSWHCVSLCAAVYEVVMLFSGSLICYLITAVVFSSEFPCSSLNFWYLHCALPWEAFSVTQVPVWQSTDRAMLALWLLCMLALVHIRVGRNTWLNADFILLTLILRMSGGKNLTLHLQEELQAGQGMALQLQSVVCPSLETLNHSCCLFL